MTDTNAPSSAQEAVLVKSETLPEDTPVIKGYDFNKGVDYKQLLESYIHSGFQATTYGQAVEEVRRMLAWRLSDDEPNEDDDDKVKDEEFRKNTKCKIFLGYTSNLISAGVRESIRFLVEHKQVDVLVTTAGGIEEDFIKCLAHTYMGDFALKGANLRSRGLNRIGNMLVPNYNYCKFETWIIPILDQMHKEQVEQGVIWTPSKMIHRLGKEINHPESVYYWAYKNNIPVFCPGITDGSIGDMLYFHSFRTTPGLIVDITQDIRAMNDQAVHHHHEGRA